LILDKGYAIPRTPHRRRLLVFRRAKKAAHAQHAGVRVRSKTCSSASNPSVQLFKKLLQARGIRKTGQAILSGKRLVEEVLRDHPSSCSGWITEIDDPPPGAAAPKELTWYRLDPALFREIDVFGTGPPLLLIDVPPIPTWSPAGPWPEGCTLFIPFQDPENVGSVIRSAAAFGAARVVLLKEAANPFLPKSCRAAGGSLLKIPLYAGPSIRALDLEEPRLYALSMKGRDLRDFRFPKTFGLLAGLEGAGLPDGFREEAALSIPMEPGFDSLNAAAAVSVALYAWYRDR
jgi:16S rRNA (guanine527-N7)-methyltransferase